MTTTLRRGRKPTGRTEQLNLRVTSETKDVLDVLCAMLNLDSDVVVTKGAVIEKALLHYLAYQKFEPQKQNVPASWRSGVADEMWECMTNRERERFLKYIRWTYHVSGEALPSTFRPTRGGASKPKTIT